MATITTRHDDLDNSVLPEDTPQTRLTLSDGRESFDVVLDLGDTSFKGLVKALGKYRSAGTEYVAPVTKPATRKASAGESDAGEIRAWAQAQGLKVSDRGAISKDVRALWEARTVEGDTPDPVDLQDAANGDMTPGSDS